MRVAPACIFWALTQSLVEYVGPAMMRRVCVSARYIRDISGAPREHLQRRLDISLRDASSVRWHRRQARRPPMPKASSRIWMFIRCSCNPSAHRGIGSGRPSGVHSRCLVHCFLSIDESESGGLGFEHALDLPPAGLQCSNDALIQPDGCDS